MDSASFNRHVKPCLNSMYRVALALCGNRDDACDAVQEACVKLLNSNTKAERIANMEAYAVGTVRNTCLGLISSKKSKCPLNEASPIPDSNDTADSIEKKDTADIIANLANTLPTNQRTVFVMRDIEGMEMKEIEDATGLSAVNIRVMLSRARRSIRKHFGK